MIEKEVNSYYDQSIRANIEVHSAMAEQYNKVEPHYRSESVNRVKSIIEQIIPLIKSENALDLGCGTGFMINILKKHFINITGVDVTQAMLDKIDLSGDSNISLWNSYSKKLNNMK